MKARPFMVPAFRLRPPDAEIEAMAQRLTARLRDPELSDLARLLNDPRVPDAYAESVRAGLRETCYQLRAVAEGRQA